MEWGFLSDCAISLALPSCTFLNRLNTILDEGLSEQEFMVTWFINLRNKRNYFSFQFRKIITRYRRIGYNLNVMRQYACLVFNPIMVDNNVAFLNCTPEGRASDSMMAST